MLPKQIGRESPGYHQGCAYGYAVNAQPIHPIHGWDVPEPHKLVDDVSPGHGVAEQDRLVSGIQVWHQGRQGQQPDQIPRLQPGTGEKEIKQDHFKADNDE